MTVPILLMIRKVIEADVTYMKSPLDLRNQRAFAVKSGINGFLDAARKGYTELTKHINKYSIDIGGTYSNYHIPLDSQSSQLNYLQKFIRLQ